MAAQFTGPRLKVERSEAHFRELNDAVKAFIEAKPYSFVHELDPYGLQKHIRVRTNFPIPDMWGCIVGDIIHNLRSALDILACDLARNNNASAASISKTYFPISGSRELFELGPLDSKGKRGSPGLDKIKSLSATDRDRIARLEPYKGGAEVFWYLHELDIADKHRLLVPVANAIVREGDLGIQPTDDEMVSVFAPGPPKVSLLKEGDILASYPVTNSQPYISNQVGVTIAFGDGPLATKSVLPSLFQMGGMVKSVIAELEKP